jgi:hypothetical protein
MHSELVEERNNIYLLSLIFKNKGSRELLDLVKTVFSGELKLNKEIRKHNPDLELSEILNYQIKRNKVEFFLSLKKKE